MSDNGPEACVCKRARVTATVPGAAGKAFSLVSVLYESAAHVRRGCASHEAWSSAFTYSSQQCLANTGAATSCVPRCRKLASHATNSKASADSRVPWLTFTAAKRDARAVSPLPYACGLVHMPNWRSLSGCGACVCLVCKLVVLTVSLLQVGVRFAVRSTQYHNTTAPRLSE